MRRGARPVGIVALVALAVLAGCQHPPQIDQHITIQETTDRDCDGDVRTVTAATAVDLVRASDEELSATVAYQTGSGDRADLETYDVPASGLERELTIEANDLDVDGETRLFLFVEKSGLFSNEQLGVDQTDVVLVESADDDSPDVNASFRYDPDPGRPGEPVTYELADSDAAGCPIESIRWDLDGDGTVDATGDRVTETYDEDGYREVTVTVVTTSGVEREETQTMLVLLDPDGDGITSAVERKRGMDPNDPDTDSDLFRDDIDPLPTSVLVPTGVVQTLLTVALYDGIRRVTRR